MTTSLFILRKYGSIIVTVLVLIVWPSVRWVYNKVTEGEVTVLLLEEQTINELMDITRSNYKKEIAKYFSGKKEIQEMIDKYKNDPDKMVSKDLRAPLMMDFFNFAIERYSHDPNSLVLLEMRNDRKTKIRKVSISVPGFQSLSDIRIVTSAIHPAKIAELETSYSLDKKTGVLFFKEIEEFPPHSIIRFYIFGFHLPKFDEVKVRFDEGSAKVIRATRIPGVEERPLGERGFELPSLELVLMMVIFVLVWYLAFQKDEKGK
jgi:hypothetical protein